MKQQLLIAGLLCSLFGVTIALIGGPPLLGVFIIGIGVGLKIAYFFALP